LVSSPVEGEGHLLANGRPQLAGGDEPALACGAISGSTDVLGPFTIAKPNHQEWPERAVEAE
jgi:hypothetical protein